MSHLRCVKNSLVLVPGNTIPSGKSAIFVMTYYDVIQAAGEVTSRYEKCLGVLSPPLKNTLRNLR